MRKIIKGIPSKSKGFDKSSSGLKEVRSYVWLDLIIVNISNNETSFQEYIKPLNDRWSKFWSEKDQKLIKHSKDLGYFKLKAKCNWKFAIENYCESYHLPWVHPELNTYSKISDHYHIQGLPNRFAGQGTVVYNPKIKGKNKFPCFPNWPKNKIKIAEYVALFPNVMLGIHKDHYYAYWLEPVNHELTIEHMEIYYVGELRPSCIPSIILTSSDCTLYHNFKFCFLRVLNFFEFAASFPT